MLRLPEMYYIAAEALFAAGDQEMGHSYLEAVRRSRGLGQRLEPATSLKDFKACCKKNVAKSSGERDRPSSTTKGQTANHERKQHKHNHTPRLKSACSPGRETNKNLVPSINSIMKKNILYLIISSLILLVSCEENTDGYYDNIARIYFPSTTDSVNFSFGDQVMTYTVTSFTCPLEKWEPRQHGK